jgi:hypothetical protein
MKLEADYDELCRKSSAMAEALPEADDGAAGEAEGEKVIRVSLSAFSCDGARDSANLNIVPPGGSHGRVFHRRL